MRLQGPASLPQALHIKITCYYMSLLLDAFQRETVPLCKESCAPQASLQSPEQRQRPAEAVTECTKGGCVRSWDRDSDRGCDRGCDRDCDSVCDESVTVCERGGDGAMIEAEI